MEEEIDSDIKNYIEMKKRKKSQDDLCHHHKSKKLPLISLKKKSLVNMETSSFILYQFFHI